MKMCSLFGQRWSRSSYSYFHKSWSSIINVFWSSEVHSRSSWTERNCRELEAVRRNASTVQGLPSTCCDYCKRCLLESKLALLIYRYLRQRIKIRRKSGKMPSIWASGNVSDYPACFYQMATFTFCDNSKLKSLFCDFDFYVRNIILMWVWKLSCCCNLSAIGYEIWCL
jgi:hypothetical protein